MATVLTEGVHGPEFLVSEANYSRSRTAATIAQVGKKSAGTILAHIAKGAQTVSAPVADGGNTGTGAFAATPTAGANAPVGTYTLTIIDPKSDAGDFQLEDPDGNVIGQGQVGTAFVDDATGISFTLNDAGTDFAAGDKFTFTVSYAASDSWAQVALSGSDQQTTAKGILYGDVDSTDGAVPGVVVDGEAEVIERLLIFPTGATDDQKAKLLADLKTLRIKLLSET